MDVRCPNCQTEYELDEGRLRPGGVTVKCASCQHVFRVRKRADTSAGVAPGGLTAPAKPTPKTEDDERSWLIRMQDGEIKVCRELATLQRWIVSGTVTNDCEISRTGKKWKPLSELKELTSFFAIAEEARDVAAGRRAAPVPPAPAVDGSVVLRQPPSKSHPHTVPRDGTRPSSVSRPASAAFMDEETVQVSDSHAQRRYVETEEETIEMTREEAQAAIEAARQGYNQADPPTPPVSVSPAAVISPKSTMLSSSPPPPVSARSASGSARTPKPSVPPPAPGSRAKAESALDAPKPARPKTQPPPLPVRDSADPSPDASWIKQAAPKVLASGQSGPTSGLAKGVPTADAAFAGSRMDGGKVKSEEFKNGRFVAVDERNTSETLAPLPSSGIGKWIVILSLLIIGGAGAALYIVLFKDGTKSSAEVVQVAVDAAPAAQALDAAASAEPATQPSADALLGALDDAIARHDSAQLGGISESLENSEDGFDRLLGLARVQSALAQHDLDAALITPKDAKQLARSAKKLGQLALANADAALALDDQNGLALITRADAMRLSGAPSREIERLLKKPASDGAAKAEQAYVTGMLRVRDERALDARKIFEGLQRSESSVRVQYRLALLSFSEGKLTEALREVQAILGVITTHEPTEALQEEIEARLAAQQASDSEDTSASSKPVVSSNSNSNSNNNNSSNTPDPVVSGDSYDRLLERADKLAETGNCGQAFKIYEKALDGNPSGVAALTGLGYCHLDAKNFASAQARFRAALGISSRYQDALWGVAEGYQQQGLADQAIAGYRKFIDEHPTSRRADMARRQIERLGGDVKPGGGGDSAQPAPAPAPAPTPAPAPDDGSESDL